MSEYQYYEFRAIDSPLTKEQMQELRSVSTRADITPYCFTNTYSFGNFKGDPDDFMKKYFDAFVYIANWGTRQLKWRLPKNSIKEEILSVYCEEDTLSYDVTQKYLIINFDSEQEESHDWEVGEKWLATLLPLRSDLIAGDYRSLYLGWLSNIQSGDLDENDIEPPVPAGLDKMSSALVSLTEFLRIDENLLNIAIKNSSLHNKIDLASDSHLRTVGQLLSEAAILSKKKEQLAFEKKQIEKNKKEQEESISFKKFLDKVENNGSNIWLHMQSLLKTNQPKNYDEVVKLLLKFKKFNLNKSDSEQKRFELQLSELKSNNLKKHSFIMRLNESRL